jgi:hypothetical protein
MSERRASFIVECFWPDVTESDLEALDRRVQKALGGARSVRYLGSTLVRADEVVLCEFEGSAEAVRATAELAGVPFERILETAHSPWSTDQDARR